MIRNKKEEEDLISFFFFKFLFIKKLHIKYVN